MARKRSKAGLGEQQWRAHIEAQEESTLSVRAYCEQHGLAVASFYYQKRRLAARPKFVEIVPVQQAQSSGVELIVGEELRVRLMSGFDEQTLVRLLGVLERGAVSC
jgi:hypothetical protein